MLLYVFKILVKQSVLEAIISQRNKNAENFVFLRETKHHTAPKITQNLNSDQEETLQLINRR